MQIRSSSITQSRRTKSALAFGAHRQYFFSAEATSIGQETRPLIAAGLQYKFGQAGLDCRMSPKVNIPTGGMLNVRAGDDSLNRAKPQHEMERGRFESFESICQGESRG